MNPSHAGTPDSRHDADPALDDALWGLDGTLAQALPGWCERPGQRRLAAEVARAIDERGIVLAEAGTGTGKTLAYLVPALQRGERLVVSTATRALQDQLHSRDIPLACEALGLQPRVARLKGRSNYVCPHRLKQAQSQGLLDSRRAVQDLRRVALFASGTSDGDLGALGGLDEQSPVIPLVTSTRDNCLGSDCPELRGCFVMKARREALAADVVVVNHHLFFANLALRDEGVAELLPGAATVVLDEAHQLADIGAQFLGQAVGTAQAAELGRDALAAGLQFARGLADWQSLSAALRKAAADLRLCAPAGAQRLERAQAQALPGWGEAVAQLRAALQALHDAAVSVAEASPDFDRIAQRCLEQADLLEAWQAGAATPADNPAQESVHWMEVSSYHVRLLSTPLGIGAAFSALVAARPQTWILVSATLTLDGSFRWARARLGLGEASAALLEVEGGVAPRVRELRVPSPFDYPRRTRLLVPALQPSRPDHPRRVAELAAELIAVNPGGSFVLTTTLRAIRIIADRLRELLPPGRTVLEQASESRAVLLMRFAADPRAVLVGSHGFWEGVDFPGDQLTLVVIDKLPFAPPDDPMVAARLRRLEASGRNGFMDYSLPQAALALQQGAGRLVRSEADWGVLAVCDERLTRTAWGRRLLGSLQPFGRAGSLAEAAAFLRSRGEVIEEAAPVRWPAAITTVSTTDSAAAEDPESDTWTADS